MTLTAMRRPDRTRPLQPRLAGAHIDAMTADAETPARAVVVGSAGSGKSGVLRHLHRALSGRGVDVVIAHPGVDLAAVPAADVVLVDDAHLLDDRGLALIAQRIDDPAAGIVVACRPWPQSDALRHIARRLEASRPAIVLGHVTATDALAHDSAGHIAAACVADILERCGNTTWLVCEALALHDEFECVGAPDHDGIAESLGEVIAHRVQALAAPVRDAVETLCLAPSGHSPADVGVDMLAAGHAEGLIQRNGQPAPVVRSAVRANASAARIAEACAAGDFADIDRIDLLGDVRDARIAAALLLRADSALAQDPRRAAALYERAAGCGADAAAVQLGRARAAWAQGQLDVAGSALDEVLTASDPAVRDDAAALSGGVWAARGLMTHSNVTYRAVGSPDPVRACQGLVAAIAAADPTGLQARPLSAVALSSTLAVSAQLLERGLRATLTPAYEGALGDLVRASEIYSATGSAEPVAELPAVIAALAAIHTGELEVAATVLDAAIRQRHGGGWARPRLTLWRAWIDLQWQRPGEVEQTLRSVVDVRTLSPRDQLLAEALRVGLARRYSDAAGLATAWRNAHDTIIRAQFDLFSILPLGEFVTSAARVGDSTRMRFAMATALGDMTRLGAPPLWAPHLHWAGIQEGILRNSPESLRPHAKELLAAAAHNRVAAKMAAAGRVWTSVLAGNVDSDAVEDAALGLADIGLAWDGARLAGHGAARSDDRRTIARLLACARQLHPTEEIRADDGADSAPSSRPETALSIREREVAVLVVQGLTYAEIGESIFISPRTAEHHIARIRRRLGATSRSDLIAKLRVATDGAAADPLSRGERESA